MGIGTRGPGRRAQASIEMLAMFGGILLVLIGILAVLPSEAAGAQSVHQQQVAQSTLSLVARAADDIYLAGEGSSRHVWVEVPEGADLNLSFVGNRSGTMDWAAQNTLSIYLPQTGHLIAVSRAPLCGSWPSTPGRYRVAVAYNSSGAAHVAVNSNC